ncbi:hypothetical protein KQI74_01330 [Paenibacillus barcinonensis]|uniref:hypothetical protein n=1 Tax=Paenibacillus TaxID=44249 RepID=UPI001C1293E4|nr:MULTISPECIES: hypothetical protein [Paenibacillus]MBU5350900.1 hypothetical protein [Paenibacillus barcinonensis]MDM5278483.1 hypothetical protein [Paenibacillus silvae]
MISIENLKYSDITFDEQNRAVVTNESVNQVIKDIVTNDEQELRLKAKGITVAVKVDEIDLSI